MTKLFKPFISVWRLQKKLKSFKLAYRFLPEILTPSLETTINFKNDLIEFKEYQKSISTEQLKLFGEDGALLLKFIKSPEVTFLPSEKNEKKSVAIHFNDISIRMEVSGYNCIKVIEEIFIDQLYDFNSVEQFVVCDVGMNIAAASLYFASLKNVEKVYGYEPFPGTFLIARKNINLNENLEKKIKIFNYGLGKVDTLLEVPEPADGFLGGTTTDFVIEELPDNLKGKKHITVSIKNIVNEIQLIKLNHPGKKIILKLDCEGAEYDIMDELSARGMLEDISVCMIEYHFRGKKKIVDILYQHHFFVTAPNNNISPFGMIYAIKNS